jgi:hypothetical protein
VLWNGVAVAEIKTERRYRRGERRANMDALSYFRHSLSQ